MAKKDEAETAPADEPKDPPKSHQALTVAHVKALIEARFIQHDIEHGYLSTEDGAEKLAALKGGA